MASLVRVGLAHLIKNGTNGGNGGILQMNVRNISGKTMRVLTPAKKPAPWDYKNKRFNIFNYMFDKTTKRLDENSKIIVVEGPIAAGKSKFAQELADELEMTYYPEANLDMIYINDYGFDMRQLDEQLPEACRSFDVNNFLLNPNNRLTARFQIQQHVVKYSQYIDALAQLLSTGQGVVLDRCVYSDFVFVEAMYSQGYISKGGTFSIDESLSLGYYKARSIYYDVRKNGIHELMRPHLIIYLDVPVEKIIENVKKRNISCEVNSQVINPQYLSTMEKYYKQKYLKDMSTHCELLVYDWTNQGEVEVVVEDIERIKFENIDEQSLKFEDWKLYSEEDWAIQRNLYADWKDFLMSHTNVPRFDVPELVTDALDAKEEFEIINSAPGNAFEKGYNKSMGDTGLFLKMAVPHRTTLPLRERRPL